MNHTSEGATSEEGKGQPLRPPTRVPYTSHVDYGERIPPPQQTIRAAVGVKPSNIPVAQQPDETSHLIGIDTVAEGFAQQPRRYVVYGDTDDSDDESYGRPKRTQLINFWASLLALILSFLLVTVSIHESLTSPFSAALTITRMIGIFFGSISVIVEFCNCVPSLAPSFLQLRLGRHVMLHLIIACFSSLPYIHNQKLLGMLFVLHGIPACLFCSARARRETNY